MVRQAHHMSRYCSSGSDVVSGVVVRTSVLPRRDGERLMVPLDDARGRRQAHHMSRPYNTWTPAVIPTKVEGPLLNFTRSQQGCLLPPRRIGVGC